MPAYSSPARIVILRKRFAGRARALEPVTLSHENQGFADLLRAAKPLLYRAYAQANEGGAFIGLAP